MGRRRRLRALEFFAGIGLARAGMASADVDVVWANDIDETKCKLYAAQWGDDHLEFGDVFDVDADKVPSADIAWASSPCTDLSLAGLREGLVRGSESKAFFGFVSVVEKMGSRAPQAVVLENVCGLASSHEDAISAWLSRNSIDLVIRSMPLSSMRVDGCPNLVPECSSSE